MRRIALIALLLAAPVAYATSFAGASDSHTYKVEMYNAFGIVSGSDVRIAGVNSGSVSSLGITTGKGGAKLAVLTIDTSGPVGVLGKDTHCSAEPQSLIAEYFLDCSPKGPALPDGGTIPASHVSETVQNDLVQNTLREPFKDRLQLLINEFGTALAGNPQELNQAIRLGAPALEQFKQALDILASENTTIRDLNANSDTIISQLARNKANVVKFIQEARDTSAISATRRADLATDFNKLDDFLGQLHPTLVKLGDTAQQQKPLLSDLRKAAPGLNTLAVKLPAFNQASQRSLQTLGRAAVPGRQALKQGKNEIQALAASGQHAFSTANLLDKFLLDLDSPKRTPEIDKRAADSCPPGTANANTKPCYSTGRPAPTGYTGFESLLNWAYYQAGAVNQFDAYGHMLHFGLFDVGASPCSSYNAGGQGATFGVPNTDNSGKTTSINDANRCVAWLGPNQPGINQQPGAPPYTNPYDPSVCPDGSQDLTLCDPSGPKVKSAQAAKAAGGAGSAQAGPAIGGNAGNGVAPQVPQLPQLPQGSLPGKPSDLPKRLQDILGLNHHGLPRLGGGLHHGGGGLGGGGLGGGGGQAANDLLNFLFKP